MRSKSLTQLTGEAFDRTKTILFTPFRWKVWFKVLLIAWLSGYLGQGGCNTNFNVPSAPSKKESKSADPAPPPTVSTAPAKAYTYKDLQKDLKEMQGQAGLVLVIVLLASVPLIGLFLLFAWLCARFSFVFVDVVSSGEVAIIAPFMRHREVARSYMGWLVGFTIFILLAVLFSLGGMFAVVVQILSATPDTDIAEILKDKVWTLLGAGLFWILLLFSFMIVCGIIGVWARDFVVPIMFNRRIGVMAAWRECLAMLRKSAFEALKYLLWRLLVNIVTGMAILMIWFALFLILLMVALVVGLIGAAIAIAVPPLQIPLIVLGILAFLVAMLVFALVLAMAQLPVAVWVRSFGLAYLESMNLGYRFFAQQATIPPPHSPPPLSA